MHDNDEAYAAFLEDQQRQPVVGRLLHRFFTSKHVVTLGPEPYAGTKYTTIVLGIQIGISDVVCGGVCIGEHIYCWPEFRNYFNDGIPDSYLRRSKGIELLIGGIGRWVFRELEAYDDWLLFDRPHDDAFYGEV